MITNTVKLKAADRQRGLTAGELRKFVADLLRADVPDDAIVQVKVGWSLQIREIWHKDGGDD